MDTLNVLEDFLEKFSGCLLLVSHDRYFMDRLVEQLFIFEGDGKIRVFNGNYSDFRSEEENSENETAEPLKPATPVQTDDSLKSKKKISFTEKKEYENLQKEIAALETERRNVEAELNSGISDHHVLTELSARFKQLTEQIDGKTLRWLELDELMSETEK
jgi:ATP-binding cassette subfamily F protein uup